MANLVSYTDDGDNNWPIITKIVVPTEYDKEQLLLALKYLHDQDIDTSFLSVSMLVHLYQQPDKIKVLLA